MKFIRAICERNASCSFEQAWIYATIEECVTHDLYAHSVFRLYTGGQFAAATAGLLVADPVAAAACFAELTDCSSAGVHARTRVTSNDEVCERMFRARCPASTGDVCWRNGDCGEGRHCDGSVTAVCGFGTCAPKAITGEPCTDLHGCRAPEGGLVACMAESSSSEARVCREVVFADPAMEGELCDAVDLDVDPVVLVPCPEGLGCRDSTPIPTGELRCTPTLPRAREGEVCPGFCEPGLFCNDADICERTESRVAVAVGEACMVGDQCDDQIGTACVDGGCAMAGRFVGEPCDEIYSGGARLAVCAAPAFCDTDTGLCATLHELGDDCGGDAYCQSGCCHWPSTAPAPSCEAPEACHPGVPACPF